MACSIWAMGCSLVAGEEWARVVNSVSRATGGIVAMVTPVEAATEGVVLVPVEVESGVPAWQAEVTLAAAEVFATSVKGRALQEEQEKLKRCIQRSQKNLMKKLNYPVLVSKSKETLESEEGTAPESYESLAEEGEAVGYLRF